MAQAASSTDASESSIQIRRKEKHMLIFGTDQPSSSRVELQAERVAPGPEAEICHPPMRANSFHDVQRCTQLFVGEHHLEQSQLKSYLFT